MGHNNGGSAFFIYVPLTAAYGTADTIELSPYIAGIVLDGSNSYLTVNEGLDLAFSLSATNESDHFDNSGMTSVGGYNSTTENSSTVAAEYIIFDSILSPSDFAKVETYLNNKYAIIPASGGGGGNGGGTPITTFDLDQLTKSEILSITNASEGDAYYATDTEEVYVWNGSNWSVY